MEIEETRLFKDVPRNYWPGLCEEINILGARSEQFGIKVLGEHGLNVNSINLDRGLLTAFVWVRSYKGRDHWLRVHDGVLNARHPAI